MPKKTGPLETAVGLGMAAGGAGFAPAAGDAAFAPAAGDALGERSRAFVTKVAAR